MKDAKFTCIFVLLLIVITLLAAALWCFLLPEDVKDTVGIKRWRRVPQQPPPDWMTQMIETNANKSRLHFSENVLLNALGQLKISGPEDVMTYITLDSPCKTLKHYSDVFERYHKDVPDKELYVRVFKAIKKFTFIYCGRDERYRKLFARNQDRIVGLHEQFEDCQGQLDWYENFNDATRCDDARSIISCYEDALRMDIGSDVARAWKCIFKAVVNEAMIRPCNFTATHEEPFYSSSKLMRADAVILFIMLVTYLMN